MRVIKLIMKIGFAICSLLFAGVAILLLLALLIGELQKSSFIDAGILFLLSSVIAWISAELAAEI